MREPGPGRRVAEAVFFGAAVYLAVRTIHGTRAADPVLADAARRPAAAAPAAPAPTGPADVPSPDRPYVRGLKIEEPPPPGGARTRAPSVASASAAPAASERAGTPSARMLVDDSFVSGRGASGGASLLGPPASEERDAAPPADKAAAAAAASSEPGGFSAAKASKIVAAARGQRADAGLSSHPEGLTPQSVATSLMVGMAEDRRVDGDLRAALKSLGPDASLEAQGAAAARVLRAHGRGADSESVAAAVSQATAPPRPAPSAAAVQNAVYDIATHIPDEATQADILKHQDDAKPIAAGPPPKGAADAYQKYHDVFEQAQKEYGVAPKHILGILSVETGFGANMGDKPLVSVLLTLETQPKKSAQAASDLRALATLAADGDLGGRTPSQVVSNYAGAYGPPQFLASSQLAYGRSADGAGTDLFKFPNAILSVANYLQKHGYGQDVPHSIFGYNHSQEYVNTVLARSESIAPLIKNAAAAPAPTAPSK